MRQAAGPVTITSPVSGRLFVTLQILLPRQLQMATESYYWTVTVLSTSLSPASLPTSRGG
jgi:hypothetical protein